MIAWNRAGPTDTQVALRRSLPELDVVLGFEAVVHTRRPTQSESDGPGVLPAVVRGDSHVGLRAAVPGVSPGSEIPAAFLRAPGGKTAFEAYFRSRSFQRDAVIMLYF